MIINKTNVRGIFLYSPDVTFEKGDFVVLDDLIYVCNSESTGISPSSSTPNFSLYLSHGVGTFDDFKKYLEGDELSGSKFISSKLLSQILSTYMSGFDERGVIGNEVTSDGRVILSDFFGNTTSSSSTSINPLDVIFETPDLNNAIFSLDPKVANSIVGSSKTSKNIQSGAILRQYTYRKSGDKNSTRIQEIIDYESGNTMFRFTVSDDSGKFISSGTEWKDSYVLSDAYKQLSNLKNYYIEARNKTLLENISMIHNFRYKSVPFEIVSFTSNNSYNQSTYYVYFGTSSTSDLVYVPGSGSCPVTIQFTYPSSTSGLVSTDSITVDLYKVLIQGSSITFSVLGGSGSFTFFVAGNLVEIDAKFLSKTGYIGVTSIHSRQLFEKAVDSSISCSLVGTGEYIVGPSGSQKTYSGPLSLDSKFTINTGGTGTIPLTEGSFSKSGSYKVLLRYAISNNVYSSTESEVVSSTINREVLVDLANVVSNISETIELGPYVFTVLDQTTGTFVEKGCKFVVSFTSSTLNTSICTDITAHLGLVYSDAPNVIVPFYQGPSNYKPVSVSGTSLFIKLS